MLSVPLVAVICWVSGPFPPGRPRSFSGGERICITALDLGVADEQRGDQQGNLVENDRILDLGWQTLAAAASGELAGRL
jgi:hypothetical protein